MSLHNCLPRASDVYIQAVWVTSIPVWAPKLWHPKDSFQVFSFQLYSNKKCVELTINDFPVHLTEEQNNEAKRCRSERTNHLQKKFYSFKYIIKDHTNIPFFFIK